MNIAIIPARGGSKRIPRKNIKSFCGKPLIAYSIEEAFKSLAFERVIVSTEDEEIGAVAKKYGASVLWRPENLADDHTGTTEVIANACKRIDGVSLVCCLYASPFVRAADIKAGYELIKTSAWQFVFSATTFAYPIFRAFRRDPVEMFFMEHFESRSQDLPEAWHDAGQFYWGAPSAWTSGVPLFNRQSMIVPIPRSRVQDLDTPEDWERAELMWRAAQLAQAA